MNQNHNNNEYEILDSDSASCQLKYPFAQAPIDSSSNFKELNPGKLSIIPSRLNEVSPFLGIAAIITGISVVKQVVSGLVSAKRFLDKVTGLLWPEDAAQKKWEEFIDLAEQLIQIKISVFARNQAIAKLIGLKRVMAVYEGAFADWEKEPTNPKNMEAVRVEFRIANDLFESSMDQFAIQDYEIQLLTVYAEAANLHLTLLRDASIYGLKWGMDQVEVNRHYNAQMNNTRMYTDHCVSWYDKGLTIARKLKANVKDQDRYPWIGPGHPLWGTRPFQGVEDWNLFNQYRSAMTLQVLDLVALWSTYDFRAYPLPTKVQLTREIYSSLWGAGYGDDTTDKIESVFTRPPHLVTHLDAIDFYVDYNIAASGVESIMGERKRYNVTNDPAVESPVAGKQTGSRKTLSVENNPAKWVSGYHAYETIALRFLGLRVGVNALQLENMTPRIGASSTHEIPDNHISWMVGTFPTITYVYPGLRTCGFSWMSDTVDRYNLITSDGITQIPAVKGYELYNGATVVRGPGSTGGDIVRLPAFNDYYQLAVKVRPSVTARRRRYNLRIRYASEANTNLFVGKYVEATGRFYEYDYFPVNQTFSGTMTYNAFKYLDTFSFQANEEEFIIDLFCNGGGPIYIDKIEFIPVNPIEDIPEPGNGVYLITTALTDNKVVDMDPSTHNVHLWLKWAYGTVPNQQWRFVYDSSQQAYQIKSMADENLVLTWQRSEANNVRATSNANLLEQYWIINDAGSGYVYIANKADQSKALDVENSSTANGTNILVWNRNGGANQKFRLNKLS